MSVTAGTVMHGSKPPLSVWFWAVYLMATHSNGIAPLQLQKQLGLGSYKWASLLCGKLRRATVAPGRAPLSGLVEPPGHAAGVHWTRNALAYVPKGQHTMVAAALRQAFQQPDHPTARRRSCTPPR